MATRTHGCAPWASLFHLPGSVPSTLFAACRNVLLSTNLFAGRDDFSAPKSEGRKSLAQCVSTGNLRTTRVSPGTGRKDSGPRASYAPFRGCLIGHRTYGCAPWAIVFRPPGSVRGTQFAACRIVSLTPRLAAPGTAGCAYTIPHAYSRHECSHSDFRLLTPDFLRIPTTATSRGWFRTVRTPPTRFRRRPSPAPLSDR